MNEGRVDLSEVSVHDWLHLSFLAMYNQEQLHLDEKLMYQGVIYGMHLCVQSANPAESLGNLMEQQ